MGILATLSILCIISIVFSEPIYNLPLGGGSLASGGLGMAGGAVVLSGAVS